MTGRPEIFFAGKTNVDVDLTRLVTAHHEAGHAVAHLVAGGRVTAVRILNDTEGVTFPAEDAPTADTRHGWLVATLAGGEAAARFLTKHGYSAGAARDLAQHGCRDDRAAFRRWARGSGISERQVRNDAYRLVRIHWSRIARVATRLNKYGRLSGSQI